MTCEAAKLMCARERPILFSGPMVRAILAGQKTQTRRLVTARGWDPNASVQVKMVGQAYFRLPERDSNRASGIDWGGVPCPFGQPGDRLWVREAWGLMARHGDTTDWHRGSVRGYDADRALFHWHLEYAADWGPLQESCFWRPSIHMPRWASRLTLEVTGIRVERLQEISEEDARAEGVALQPTYVGTDGRASARTAFRFLWDSLNAKRAPWQSNPWVWVVSFRRLEAP